MRGWFQAGRNALLSASIASAVSTAALMLAAATEGKGALRPTNATSHWLNGPAAADVTAADVDHTAVGYLTHHAATWFWAVLFERWVLARRARTPRAVACGAVAVAAIAVVVDYEFTPKRFTPGWEFVLTKRSMGIAYAAMALGLAAGALLERRR